MKPLFQILSLAALLTLTACGPGADPAVGTWKLDNAATLETASKMMETQMEGQPDEMKKMAADMMKKSIEAMNASITLKADGTASASMTMPNPLGGEPMQNDATGTWKNENGDVTISMAAEGEEPEAQVAKLEGDTMTVTESKGGQEMTMVFKRQAQ